MSTNLPSTYQLLDEYYNLMELRDTKEAEGISAEEQNEINQALIRLDTQMAQKVDNILHFKNAIKQRIGAIEAGKDVLHEEIKRLNARINTANKVKERIEHLAISLIEASGTLNNSGNLSIRTDLANYTVVERWGALNITNQSKVPPELIKIVQTVNQAEARNAAISAGGQTDYGYVERKKGLLVK